MGPIHPHQSISVLQKHQQRKRLVEITGSIVPQAFHTQAFSFGENGAFLSDIDGVLACMTAKGRRPTLPRSRLRPPIQGAPLKIDFNAESIATSAQNRGTSTQRYSRFQCYREG